MHLMLENGRLTSPICMKKGIIKPRNTRFILTLSLKRKTIRVHSRAPLETKRELSNADFTSTALAVLVLPLSVVALMTQMTHLLRGCILKRSIIALLVW